MLVFLGDCLVFLLCLWWCEPSASTTSTGGGAGLGGGTRKGGSAIDTGGGATKLSLPVSGLRVSMSRRSLGFVV